MLKTKLFHVVKNDKFKPWQKFLIYIGTILAAVLIGIMILASMKVNVAQYLEKLFLGAFKRTVFRISLAETFAFLLLVSVGTAFTFKMKFWNIGGEGQIIVGAIFATVIANIIGGRLPQGLSMIFILSIGAISAGIFALFMGLFKVKFGASETLLTLMSNYIALFTLKALKKNSFFNVPNTRPQFRQLPENGFLPSFKIESLANGRSYEMDIFIIISILMIIFMFIYFKFMKQGYEVSVVGDSVNTARYAGMNVTKIMLRTIFASGAIIGLAGALQVTGNASGHTLSEEITGNMGWTAIIVVWIAKLNPLGIIGMAFFMSIINVGLNQIGSFKEFADVLQGLILFFMLIADFIVSYKLIFNERFSRFFNSGKIRKAEKQKEEESKKEKIKHDAIIVNFIYSLKSVKKDKKSFSISMECVKSNKEKKNFLYRSLTVPRGMFSKYIENGAYYKSLKQCYSNPTGFRRWVQVVKIDICDI